MNPWPMLFVIATCAVTASALAETCKYIDSQGNTIYSNYSIRNATKFTCFTFTPATEPEAETQPAQRSPAPKSATAAKRNESQRDFLRVDKATQRRRDIGRRQILEEELNDELRLLDQARQTLANDASTREIGASRDAIAPNDRTQPMREAVQLHQRNIEAIENELKRIR